MILGIIPARGGSKRLPGKNTRPLAGKPMIEWTIDAAKAAVSIDHFVVCTEDANISMAAEAAGAESFRRPPEMAQDDSSIYDTIFHVLDAYRVADWVVLLQPTSPLRTAEDIDRAVTLCMVNTAPACVSCEFQVPVPNGGVYVAYVRWLREHRNYDGPRTVTYMMPSYRSVDVDTIEDFERAEALLKQDSRK
jgi:CMP-N,N'-diacetyllegionaminic acid synthase